MKLSELMTDDGVRLADYEGPLWIVRGWSVAEVPAYGWNIKRVQGTLNGDVGSWFVEGNGQTNDMGKHTYGGRGHLVFTTKAPAYRAAANSARSMASRLDGEAA